MTDLQARIARFQDEFGGKEERDCANALEYEANDIIRELVGICEGVLEEVECESGWGDDVKLHRILALLSPVLKKEG